MEGLLRVTPAELKKTASSFSARGKNVAMATDNMLTKVRNLTSIWEGEASDAYIRTFSGLQDDILRINNMIQEHSSDLIQMADNYISGEDKNTTENQSLSQSAFD